MRNINGIPAQRRFLFPHFLSALLIVSMVLPPSHVYAVHPELSRRTLRPVGLEESEPTKKELTRQLLRGATSTGLEEKPDAPRNPSPALYGLIVKNGIIQAPEPDKLRKYLENVVVPFWVIVPRWTEQAGKMTVTGSARVEVQPIPPENTDRAPIRLVVLDSEQLTDAELDRMREDSLRYINEREWLGVIDPTHTPERRGTLRKVFAALISGNQHHFNAAIRYLVRSPKSSLSRLPPYRKLLALNGWYRHGPEGSIWAESNPGTNVVYVPSDFSPAELKRFVRGEWGMAALDEHPWFFALFDQIARTPVDRITLDEKPGLIRQLTATVATVKSGSAQTFVLPPIDPSAPPLIIRRFKPEEGEIGRAYQLAVGFLQLAVAGKSVNQEVQNLAHLGLILGLNGKSAPEDGLPGGVTEMFFPEGMDLAVIQRDLRSSWSKKPQNFDTATSEGRQTLALMYRFATTSVDKMIEGPVNPSAPDLIRVPDMNPNAPELIIRRFTPGVGPIGEDYKRAEAIVRKTYQSEVLVQIVLLCTFNRIYMEDVVDADQINWIYLPVGVDLSVLQESFRSQWERRPQNNDTKPRYVTAFFSRITSTPVAKMVESETLVPPINTNAPPLIIYRFKPGEGRVGKRYQDALSQNMKISQWMDPTNTAMVSGLTPDELAQISSVIGINAAYLKAEKDPLRITEIYLAEGLDPAIFQENLRLYLELTPEFLQLPGMSALEVTRPFAIRLATTPVGTMVEAASVVPPINADAPPLVIHSFRSGEGVNGLSYQLSMRAISAQIAKLGGGSEARSMTELSILFALNETFAGDGSDPLSIREIDLPEGIVLADLQRNIRSQMASTAGFSSAFTRDPDKKKALAVMMRLLVTPTTKMVEAVPLVRSNAPPLTVVRFFPGVGEMGETYSQFLAALHSDPEWGTWSNSRRSAQHMIAIIGLNAAHYIRRGISDPWKMDRLYLPEGVDPVFLYQSFRDHWEQKPEWVSQSFRGNQMALQMAIRFCATPFLSIRDQASSPDQAEITAWHSASPGATAAAPNYAALQRPLQNPSAPTLRVIEIDPKQITDADLDFLAAAESGPKLTEPFAKDPANYRRDILKALKAMGAKNPENYFIGSAARSPWEIAIARIMAFYIVNQWWRVHARDNPEIRDAYVVVPKGWNKSNVLLFIQDPNVWVSLGSYLQNPRLAKHGRWFWELGERIAATPNNRIKGGDFSEAQEQLTAAVAESAKDAAGRTESGSGNELTTNASAGAGTTVETASGTAEVISSGETERDPDVRGELVEPQPVWKHADVSLPDRIHAQGNIESIIESISDWETFLVLVDPDTLAALNATDRDAEQREGNQLLASLLNGLIRWDLEQWVISQARASIPWNALRRSLAEEDYPGSYRASLLSLLLRSVDRDQLIRLLGDSSFIAHLEQLHRQNDFMEGATAGARATISASASREDLASALVSAIQAHDLGLSPGDQIALGGKDDQIRPIVEEVLRAAILPSVGISSLDSLGASGNSSGDIQDAIVRAKSTVEKGVRRSTNGGSSTKAAGAIRDARIRVSVVEMILTRRSLLNLYRMVYSKRQEVLLLGELASAGRLDELFVAEAVQQDPNQIPDLFSILGVTIERRPERVWTWAADPGEWQVNVALLDKGLKSQLGKFKNDENATWHETTVRIGKEINYYRGWDFAQIWGILTGDGRTAYIQDWAEVHIPKPSPPKSDAKSAGGSTPLTTNGFAGLTTGLEESGDPIADGLNALYAVPDLFRAYFGNRQGTFSRGGAWQNFLQAVSDDEDDAIASKNTVRAQLDKLPRGMSAYRMHADLLVHKQTGRGIVVLGAPGTGKSLLSAVAAGDSAQGYSSPGESAAWEYRVDDWVLVAKIGDRLYAGLPPENVNKLSTLKTRLPLPNAVRVQDDDSGGAIRYQTQLREKPGFVPLEAIVWLNNQEHLQQTRNWDLIFGHHTEWKSWAKGFFNRFMALPFREIILPEGTAVKSFDPELLTPSLEAAASIQQWFEGIPSSGLEERRALRFDAKANDMILIKETGASWAPLVPTAPQQLIAPNDPPWAIQVPESELDSLAQFLVNQYNSTFIRASSLQIAGSSIVDRIAQVYPSIPGLDSYRGSLDMKRFIALVEMLHYQLYQRAGAAFIFAPSVGLMTYATMERPWQKVPYLDGRAFTWETQLQTQMKQQEPSGFVRGWAFRNISAYDPGQARSSVEATYKEFLAQAQNYGIPAQAVALVRSLYEGQKELFLNYFGEQASRDEERSHARDYLWAAHFFSDVFKRPELDIFQKHLVAEATIRPNSPLDQTVWNPEKVRNELRSVHDLAETSGQTQGVVDLMDRLVQEQHDDFAEAFFWFYLFEKFRETRLEPGKATPGRDRTAAEWVLNYVRKNAGQKMDQVYAYLRSPVAGQTDLAPGKRALALIQGFHDENFLTETDRIAMLDKAAQGQLVSLGARQPVAGLEEETVEGNIDKMLAYLPRASFENRRERPAAIKGLVRIRDQYRALSGLQRQFVEATLVGLDTKNFLPNTMNERSIFFLAADFTRRADSIINAIPVLENTLGEEAVRFLTNPETIRQYRQDMASSNHAWRAGVRVVANYINNPREEQLVLVRRYREEIYPLRNDFSATLDYFQSRDNKSSPFFNRLRAGVSQSFGIPEDQILFLPTSDLLMLRYVDHQATPQGAIVSFGEFQNPATSGRERLIFIFDDGNNDPRQLIETLFHEISHWQQSDAAASSTNRVFRALSEGWQDDRITPMLFDAAVSDTDLGALIRETLAGVDHINQDSIREAIRLLFDRKGYSVDKRIVRALMKSRKVSSEQMERLFMTGSIEELQKFLGERYSSMNELFRQWETDFDPSRRYDVTQLILVRIIVKGVIEPDQFYKTSGQRLVWFVNGLGQVLDEQQFEGPLYPDPYNLANWNVINPILDYLGGWAAAYSQKRAMRDEVMMGRLTQFVRWRASQSGLEEGQRLFDPVGVIASQRKLLIFTPEMAVESARVMRLFKPYQGEKISAAIIVDDLEQKQVVESLLPDTIAVQWVVLSETPGKKWEDAVVDIQIPAWQRSIDTYVIQSQGDLDGLGKFLGIAPVDERTYQEWVQAVATLSAA